MQGLGTPFGAFPILVILYGVVLVIVHIMFALGVSEASKRGQTYFVGSMGWTLATLILGPLFAGVYWLIHHSTLGGFDDNKHSEVLDSVRAERKASSDS